MINYYFQMIFYHHAVARECMINNNAT